MCPPARAPLASALMARISADGTPVGASGLLKAPEPVAGCNTNRARFSPSRRRRRDAGGTGDPARASRRTRMLIRCWNSRRMIEVQRAYELGQIFLDQEDKRIAHDHHLADPVKETAHEALQIAATGMSAQQTRVDVISNNLANMSTTGYNARRAEFRRPALSAGDSPAGTISATRWVDVAGRRPAWPWRAARCGDRRAGSRYAQPDQWRSGCGDRRAWLSGGHACPPACRPIPAMAG